VRRRFVLPLLLALAACLAAAAPDEKVAAEAAPQVNPELAKRLEPFKAKLKSPDPEERQAAYRAFLDAGDDGRTLLREALLPLRKELADKVAGFAIPEGTAKRLLKAHEMMAAARAEALRVIFDTRIYPDANHGRAGQPIVDQAVNAVKTLYKPYEDLVAPAARQFATALRMHERLVEFDKQLLLCNVADMELEPPLKTLMSRVEPELVDILAGEAEFRRYCFLCLRHNRLVRTTLSAGERKVIDLTNEYRMQLGIRPLAVNEKLVQAARKHSAEMASLGYFGHASPKPERRTPGQRCALEGYGHFRGENCASGAGAEGAFRMWYNSSGHHRNMIGPGSTEIGVGYAGPWTEDFGASPDLDLDSAGGAREREPAEPKAKPKKKPFPWDEFFRY